MGRRVDNPVSPQQKVTAIHSLARDDQVAAQVTGDLLRRPQVATKVPVVDKVRVVEEFTRDEGIAAQVTTGLLRRQPHPKPGPRRAGDAARRHRRTRLARADPHPHGRLPVHRRLGGAGGV
ncbi:hypothetical protein GCM10018772_23650 [Streptomyces fumanus]|uniref:Uncharacterized protein n=1 Tax=Streptomyces fumanus TaxID=67302 RepID=A0A919AC18_9ACTN|nr:hypothetical protein GCM10018772_23650 [Streptomyces fumanus]